MKKHLAFILTLVVALAAPLVASYAQSFEGTVHWSMTIPKMDDEKHEMVTNIKGDKSQSNIDLGVQGQIKTFMQDDKIYIAMMAMKSGFVMTTPKALPASIDSSLTLKATGQKANIAGHDAEEYLLHTSKADIHMWASGDFPKSMIASLLHTLASQPGKDASQKAAFKQLADKGLFPVRLVVKSGEETEATMEFVSYEEKKLDDSIFELPKNIKFNPMPAMPGGGM